jgi:DNA topoisomerase-1
LKVALRLGNTPTICRKCYIHPEVLNAYLDGKLVLDIKAEIESEGIDELGLLQPEEAALFAMLRARMAETAG